MLYLLFKIGSLIALILPVGAGYWLADVLGSLYYLLAKKDRKIVKNNMAVVLKQPQHSKALAKISRMVFVSFARYLVEFFRSGKIDQRFLKERIEVEGEEHLKSALNLGRGVLLVGAHLGNWELAGMVLSMLGYNINVVAWVHKNRLINNFFLEHRESKGVKVIPLGSGIRKVFSALKNNELVGLLGDIDYTNPEAGIKVKLFGQDTLIPKGPALFSLKTGCPIVPAFMLREKDNTFKFRLEKPIIHNYSGNQREQALTEITEEVGKCIESYVVRYPEQWFMLTPRWQKG
jgi:KDO2-lipid IV(A) lauroyltransferase